MKSKKQEECEQRYEWGLAWLLISEHILAGELTTLTLPLTPGREGRR
jgi:hypothetical protein